MNTFIIAEVGINHNGDIELAKKLIDMAKDAGCHAVKFQKRTIDIIYHQDFLAGPRESPWGTTQREQKEGLEFGKEEYDEIDRHCKEKGIEWFASAWDSESQEFLRQYDLKNNKVASAMLTNIPLLEKIAEEGRHTYIATGMSTFEEIDRAVEIFKSKNCLYSLLQCVSTYPSEDDEINLAVMDTLRERYGCDVGFSGHERGIFPTVLAVAKGACAIERHITLDKEMYGSDQKASIDGDQLRELVKQVKRVETILGDGTKTFSEREKKVAKSLRYFD